MTEESYPAFGKVPRWNRNVVVTEKIDGTNGLISIQPYQFGLLKPYELIVETEDEFMVISAGSRNRWLDPSQDNYGFASWVWDHSRDLVKLGFGLHYGEWYGQGINRGYGLSEKRFMLFNTSRWSDPEVRPESCEVSTILYEGKMNGLISPINSCGCCLDNALDEILYLLKEEGSSHVPGFMNPEGVMIYHKSANQIFKITLQNDDEPKGKVNADA